MMKSIAVICLAVGCCMLAVACGERIAVVDSGTYQGTIAEVNADEQEIYVELADGKTIELYFTEETTLTRDGEDVPFAQLKTGQRVSVEVERVGNRLDPVAVEIIE